MKNSSLGGAFLYKQDGKIDAVQLEKQIEDTHSYKLNHAKTESLPQIGKKILLLECILITAKIDLATPYIGSDLHLKREPNGNGVDDKWATAVYAPDGVKLGFLPIKENQSVARLIDAGKTVLAQMNENRHLLVYWEREEESINYVE